MSEKKIRVLSPLPHPDEERELPRVSVGRIPREDICEMCQNLFGSLLEFGRECREKGIKFRRFEMFESCTVADAQRQAEEDEKIMRELLPERYGVEVSEEDDG